MIPLVHSKGMWGKIILWIIVFMEIAPYRLPNSLRPLNYHIFVAYHLDPQQQFPFFGLVYIEFLVYSNTDQIILHCHNMILQTKKISIAEEDGPPCDIINIELENELQLLNIKLSKPLSVGRIYLLTIPYKGKIGPVGAVFSNTYMDSETNQKKFLIATHFQPTSARQAFPCFDEPNLKANFTINIAHHINYTSISNMPVEKKSNKELMVPYWTWDLIDQILGNSISNTWVWDQFKTSLPMSTYLVAWVISEFVFICAKVGHVNVRIWVRKGGISQAKYALNVSTKLISYYEKWFDIPFPLPKLDIIAIPDFASGAMENWGLITFREFALLLDPEQSSIAEKERIVEVLAHELAHQWLGNLVTISWWTDQWLSEGFATFMAIVAKNEMEPKYCFYESDIAIAMRLFLELDALSSTHPVLMTVEDSRMYHQIYDVLSYQKGAMLFKMMKFILGDKTFKTGINRYLLRHAYSNTDHDVLWNELTTTSDATALLPNHISLKKVLDTWTLQPGFPLLKVIRNYIDNTINVTRYSSSIDVQTKLDSDTSGWWIPLTISNQTDTSYLWLSPIDGVKAPYQLNNSVNHNQWFLLNTNMVAPLRVLYDDQNWELLDKALHNPKYYKIIPVLSRVQIISDAFSLARVSQLSYAVPLNLVTYLYHESEYAPMETGLKCLWDIGWTLIRDPNHKDYLKYMQGLLTPLYSRQIILDDVKVVWYGCKRRMQVLTRHYACQFHVEACEKAAVELFSSWMSSKDPDASNPIPPDLRPVMYCSAIRRGNSEQWNFLNKRRLNSNVASETLNILKALACVEDRKLISEYLSMTLYDYSSIRTQDKVFVIQEVLKSPGGYEIAHDFFLARTNEIMTAFRGQSTILGILADDLVSWYNTKKELEKFLDWCNNNTMLVFNNRLKVDQAVEKARFNIDWYSYHSKHISQFLKVAQTEQSILRMSEKSSKGSSRDNVSMNRLVIVLFAFLRVHSTYF